MDDTLEQTGAPVNLPKDLEGLTSCRKLQLQAALRHDGAVFARMSTHIGDSLIRFCARGKTGELVCGSMKYIYKSDCSLRLKWKQI